MDERKPPTHPHPPTVNRSPLIYAPPQINLKKMVRRGARLQPYKSPAFAGALAAMSPGSGQLWVGYLQRGLLAGALSFLCGIGYFWGIYDAYQLAQKANRGEIEANDDFVFHAYFSLPLVMVLVIAALVGYAIWHEWSTISGYLSIIDNINNY